MATRQLIGQIYSDASMRHGDIRVEGPRLTMTPATWRTLVTRQLHVQVFDLLQARGDGTYPIPAGMLVPSEHNEVRRALDYVEPGGSDTCVLPTCLQPTAVYHDGGFPLCRGHAEELADWDVLIA